MPSGQFLLRIDPALHGALKVRALALTCSLNDLCAKRLRLPSCLENLDAQLNVALTQLTIAYADRLVGIAVFGSWARGDARDESDLDLLVVLDSQKKITRADYNLCPDLGTADPRVELHLVVLPETQAPVTGLWAEIAMSGLILLDHSLELQRYLSKVRNLIAEGKLLRKRAHGHDYWVHEGVA